MWRKTWLTLFSENSQSPMPGARYFFLVAQSEDDSIKLEADEMGDIVIAPFMDDYKKLPDKVSKSPFES